MFPKAGENGRKIGFLHVMSLMSRLRQKVLCKEVKTITEDAGVTMSRNETGELTKTKTTRNLSLLFRLSRASHEREKERSAPAYKPGISFVWLASTNTGNRSMNRNPRCYTRPEYIGRQCDRSPQKHPLQDQRTKRLVMLMQMLQHG